MNPHWIDSGARPKGFEWTGGKTLDSNTGRLVEAVIGEPNFRNIWWLEEALKAAQSVARVRLPAGSATGFLVGPDIFMTNNHVFENEQDAKNARLQFNYRRLADDTPAVVDVWECDPDEMFKTNPELDYSIVKVKKKDEKNAGDIRGCFNLRHGVTISVNQRVNIIQHPRGMFQQIAFRDNQVKDVRDKYIQYITDTDYGTSGSPVLDDWFHVVALHNQRVRDPDTDRWYRNQGYRVEAILDDVGNLIP